jgi:hypothetical protein
MLCFASRGLSRFLRQLRNPPLCVAVLVLLSQHLIAQSGTATLSGAITDAQGALLPNVQVTITNEDTGISIERHTNSVGIYSAPALPPGRYRVLVTREGFMQVYVQDITLHVQDAVDRNFTLQVGGTSETVQVNGDGQNINTTDATVGTVIDRQFVEEIPLNGRSFQSLILLSPGVVTETPQQGVTHAQGQFSVNGQPADSNNFTLDGASASNTNYNTSDPINGGAGSAGMAFNSTSLGTTQAIISIDALQEFRIATSTYSAEFGQQPGAQVSFQSRSGTSEYHGTAFDYLRNSAFDANDWFNGYSKTPVATPQERQNDFGGVLGGPLSVPKLFSGRNRAFFFVSYEGLRLTQPAALKIAYVPSNGTFNTANYSNSSYENLRANAPSALRPLLNSFPLPNCSVSQDAQCVDYGDGLSPFLYSGNRYSSVNAISGRVDFQVAPWMRVFARYSDTESTSVADPSGAARSSSSYRTRVYLLGADTVIGASTTNELRLQYSPSLTREGYDPTSFGGAQPVSWNSLQGLSPVGGETSFQISSPNGVGVTAYQLSYGTRQFQSNAVDTLSWQHGDHLFRTGVNYRQTTVYFGRGNLSRAPWNAYIYQNANQILQNSAYTATAQNILRQDPTFKNLGLFFQDEWRLRPRLSLSLGLRWDLNPAASLSGAQQYTYTGNLDNPSSLRLAPLGTPLYKTTYTNFGPRVGIAVVILNQPGHELVFRGGGGLFYSTGQSLIHVYGQGNGLGTGYEQYFGTFYNKPQAFPLPPSVVNTPVPPIAAPYSLGYLPENDYHPPSAIHWSASLEQALGEAQSIVLGYVSSEGMDIAHWATSQPGSSATPNTLFNTFQVLRNGPGSNYNSLQLQYKRRAVHGLQVQAAYTWSHAIDSNSSDYFGQVNLQRGNSDTDVRNNFTAAAIYNLPNQYASRWQRLILGNWNLDMRFTARSAFPVQLSGPNATNSITGQTYVTELNYNGQNPYVYKQGIPGGREFNPAVFSVPVSSQNGNGTSPRNFLRGFGETQADVAVQRTFSLYEQWRMQFRMEAFNPFNHPTFGAINVTCGSSTPGAVCTNPLLGQATSTLSNSLSGLSALYQQGGPRSLQFALKLQF